MQARSSDGVQISFDTSGSGDVAVIFIHGWCCERGHWHAQMEHFAQSYVTVAVDLAGHGASGQDRPDWTMQAFGEDIACVLDEIGINSAVLVGHSMGGPVAVEAALLRPGCVAGIVGADSLFDFYADPFDAAGFTSDFEATMERVVEGMFDVESHPAQRRFATSMRSSPMDVAVGARSAISAWGAGCFRQSMQNLTVPVRAIQQQRDEDGLSRLRAYAPGLPSFDVMEMADVGHFVMLDDPATFNQLLTECLVEILGAGPKASHNTSRNPATDKGE